MSYTPTFVPEGCTDASPAVTVGVCRLPTYTLIATNDLHLQAGVQWGEAYAFAESQNITLVGGACVCRRKTPS